MRAEAVQALTDCLVATIDYAEIDRLLVRHPKLSLVLWRMTMLEASILRERLSNARRGSALQKVANLLCEQLARREAVGITSPVVPITQVDVADVVRMYRFGMSMGSYHDAALLILRQHGKRGDPKSAPVEQAPLEIDSAGMRTYFVALARIEGSFAGQADAAIPKLRRVLENPPDLDLLIRLTDEPIVARRAFDMRRALRDMASLFDPDSIPLTSEDIRRACDSVGAGTPTPTDLETLSRYENEAVLSLVAVVESASLVEAIGVHRSRWTRDMSWKQLREAASD